MLNLERIIQCLISLCVQVDRSKVVDCLTADDLHVIMQAEDEVHGYTVEDYSHACSL